MGATPELAAIAKGALGSEEAEPLGSEEAALLESEAAALLERWAPNFAQSTSPNHPERDRPLAVDFDGDWIATNNWRHLRAAHRSATPTVYGAAVLTQTHAYLTYTLFYPRDWFIPVCVPYICHDNDLEVVLAVVERDGAGGRLVLIETKTHNRYLAAPGGDLELSRDGRPWLKVESEGHGMHPVLAGQARSLEGTRHFVAAAAAPNPEAERYQLAPLHSTLWAHRHAEAATSQLWASGETGFLAYDGARQGRRGALMGASMAGREYAGGVRPPWGLRAAVGERGDWFLDPALISARQHPQLLTPSSTSLNYVFNPFLADLGAECVSRDCPLTQPPVSRAAAPTALAGGSLVALGLASLCARRRRAGATRRARRRSTRP